MRIFDQRLGYPLMLGGAHGLADAASGFAIATFALLDPNHAVTVILIYNGLAFTMQPFVGLLVDQWRSHQPAVIGGLVLMAIGLAVFSLHAIAGLAVIALGSASFHVGAGAMSAKSTPDQAVGPGLFTAPGVIGLALGTLGGLQSWSLTLPLLGLLMIGAICLSKPQYLISPADQVIWPVKIVIPSLILLSVAVALRSASWTAVGQIESGLDQILILGLAAGLGKFLGGLVADRLGWTQTAVVGIVLAALCLSSAQPLAVVALGVALLQSSTPIVLAASVKLLPRFPATASGLVLGLALVVGGLLTFALSPHLFFGNGLGVISLSLCALCLGVGLWLESRRTTPTTL